MNIGVHRLLWIGVSRFLGYNPKNPAISGSKDLCFKKVTLTTMRVRRLCGVRKGWDNSLGQAVKGLK